MNRELLEFIFEKSKLLKSDIIFTHGSEIFGVNEDYTILTTLNVFENLPDMSFSMKVINPFMKAISETNDEVILKDNILSCGIYFIDIGNWYHREAIINKYWIFVNNIHNPILEIEDLKSYTDNIMFGMKSDEKKVIKLTKELMTVLHGNILPINKSDNVSLKIYPFNQSMSIYLYNIKKKKGILNVYMCCLNID